MKDHIETHVNKERHKIFNQSTDRVKQSLEVMVENLEVELTLKINQAFVKVERDYSVFMQAEFASEASTALIEEAELKKDMILQFINSQGSKFLSGGLE